MSRTVGGFLAKLLAANDIDTVFGIPGVHNLELYRGLTTTPIRHVLVRHEQGAGFAADGFARLSGRAAAAFVISGPGLTNIMTAVAQAYSDSVPLLVIASAPVRASFTKQWGVLHELYDQAALAAGVFGIARSAGRRRGCARTFAALPRLVPHGAPAPGVFGNSAGLAGRADGLGGTAICIRTAAAASGLRRSNRSRGASARRGRASAHHRRRRRAARRRGAAPPGRVPGLSAGDDGGGQGVAPRKSCRELRHLPALSSRSANDL